MTELYVAEKFWPTGEPAELQRVLLMGYIFRSGITGNSDDIREANRILKKLMGMADPKTINKRGMSAQEIKHKMMGLM